VGLSEFELIDRFFRRAGARRQDVRLGIGDDAAILDSPLGYEIVAAIDTLVEGVHFPVGCPAASIGHRALAVNLSDLAAMGARPAWALLALTMKVADEAWLEEFTAGFAGLARTHQVALVGGDTTSGPLCVSVQVLGHVPRSSAVLRSGGKPGDVLFVSGTPGDSGAGLQLELGKLQGSPEAAAYLRERFLYPTPRVALGERLRQFASACIDVSDGLLGDASKLARASGCGAQIQYADVPLSEELIAVVGETRARELALTGGEDFELCFAVRPDNVGTLRQQLPPDQWGYRNIGILTEAPAVDVVAPDASVMHFSHSGWDHFGA
jgi:thiamine-monophosphate kinase